MFFDLLKFSPHKFFLQALIKFHPLFGQSVITYKKCFGPQRGYQLIIVLLRDNSKLM